MIFDIYECELELLREMLGTNPLNPNIMETHIIQRQRKIIAGESKINKNLIAYVDARQISDEKAAVELTALKLSLESTLGEEISETIFEELKSGKITKLSELAETVSTVSLQGTTVFFRKEEATKTMPAIGNHMILGFLKAAGEAISRTMATKKGTMLQSSSYTSSIINQHCSVYPYTISASEDVKKDLEGHISYLQRSIRGMTPQGPRVSLGRAEVLPEGTKFKFQLKVMKNSPLTKDILDSLFSYGELKGLGQWRNADFGQFKINNLNLVSA